MHARVEKINVYNLIEEWTKTRSLFLPAFQREFVWDEKKIKNFIDSIINEYPIGSIILWKPSKQILESDNFKKPLKGKSVYLEEKFYVLDGQQRLTSLFLLFNGWKLERDGKKIERRFISISSNGKLYIGKRGINLYDVIRAFVFMDMETVKKLEEKIPPKFFSEIKNIARRIRDYELPVYIIETTGEDEKVFEEMADVFVRINRSGVRIGGPELMLSFLAGKLGGEFKKKVSKLQDELENKFNIKLSPVIRFVLSNLGLKQSEITKVDSFKSSLSKIESIPENEKLKAVELSREALLGTIKFLKEKLGIVDLLILPSQISIIPIATYFYLSRKRYEDLTSYEIEGMTKWFILANFFGRYSSRTDSKLQQDLAIVQNNLDKFPSELLIQLLGAGKDKIRWVDVQRGLEKNILRGSSGKSFLFLLYVILVKNGADDWTGISLHSKMLDDLDRHHIFPREFLKNNLNVENEDDLDEKINNLGNITFISKNKNEEIQDKEPMEYLKDLTAESRKKHFIPEEETLWKIDNYEDFCKIRVKKMYEACKREFPLIFE